MLKRTPSFSALTSWHPNLDGLPRPLPLFVCNQFGDLERCALRDSNVHSADGWDDVLKPVVARYQGKVSRIYFRADAAFAMPEVYEFLEAERIKYAIRLPANQVLQSRIGYCSRAPSHNLRTMCAGAMRASAIRPEPGPSRGGLSPRSSGIPENFIPASASS
jgi:Transposase DDE domain group 1